MPVITQSSGYLCNTLPADSCLEASLLPSAGTVPQTSEADYQNELDAIADFLGHPDYEDISDQTLDTSTAISGVADFDGPHGAGTNATRGEEIFPRAVSAAVLHDLEGTLEPKSWRHHPILQHSVARKRLQEVYHRCESSASGRTCRHVKRRCARKTKKPKPYDQDHPKRKPNGYFTYLKDYRNVLQDPNSFAIPHNLMLRVAGKMWYYLPDSLKAEYGRLAAEGGSLSESTSIDAMFRAKQHGFNVVPVPLVLAGMRALVRSCVDIAFDDNLTETRVSRDRYTSVDLDLALEVAVLREKIYARWTSWLGISVSALPPLFDEADAALTMQDLRPFGVDVPSTWHVRKAKSQPLRENGHHSPPSSSCTAPPALTPEQLTALLTGVSTKFPH